MKSKLLIPIFVAIATAAFGQVDSADFFYQKGLKEKELGRKLEMWKNFDKAYKYNPNDKAIVTELANVLLDLKKYGQAREMFKNLEKMGDNSVALYKQLMDLSFNTKQFDDALVYAQKLKTADPAAKVNFYAGKIHYDRDNYGEAIKCLQVAQKEETQNAEVPYLIARSYADMMNYKLSIPYFLKAIELDTTKNNWVYELGLICYAMNADKDALKYILLAADRGYKRDNDYMENLGIAYLNVGNLNEGLGILKEILAKKPSDMNLLNMIAEGYYYSGKFTEAIDYWDQVLTYDKTNAQALYMIGLSYQKKGEKDKGMALCDKAIEMDPSLAVYKQKKSMMGL
ncbi:MAG: tetratricopeptide repeat protein, partial [Chitinophagaceae bacterium]